MLELLGAADKLITRGDIVVVGCSSSEIGGARIGTFSSPEIGEAVFRGVIEPIRARGLYLAAQCCEHLNRALVVEREAAILHGLEIVNAIPQPKAGGSFATAAYAGFADPVVVSSVVATAGLDIGGTLIGMHLKPVAVPVKLTQRKIGDATLIAARYRPRFVGGVRAVYNEELL
jgi:uncharacterized protein (TIGR01440 family)